MFYLHVSNRTENLLRHMAEVMRADKQPDLFSVELFLIQSQGMERMIAQTLADEFRSFCNFKFFLPIDFLGFIAERLGMGISPDGFKRQTLTWRLDGLLRDLTGEAYQPIRTYLSGENQELKRFQLARRLANIFDQYQLMRSEMLSKWERGLLATAHPAEGWQMDLWLRLLAQPGGGVHRGMQFRQVIERLKNEKSLANLLPKRISVIGLHIIPPIFLNFLNCLSNHMDVHLFLLSPCRNYWGNVESQKTQFKRLVRNQTEAIQPDLEEHHPLLAVLGRQGRDLQNMMLEGANFALEFSSYDDPLEGKDYADGTILQRLQADLLNGCLPACEQDELVGVDDSIQVVSCHSKLREITVLKDHLLHLLHLNPVLELRDIIVMAPDIQEYAPLIPAVFETIQHSIADRSIRRRNSIIAAFLSFLDLFNGRFGWSEVLDLLRQPVLFPQFQLVSSDLDILQQWVLGSGIRWGLSGIHRAEAGLPGFDESSWRAGLDRLLMGYAIESEECVDGVLPFADIEGRGAYALGGLCQFIEVIEGAQCDFQKIRTVGNWSETLLATIQQLFGDDYEQELVELRTMVSDLSESISPFHSGDVEFKVIHEWFKQSAKDSRSSTGFLRGQLTFCSMLPMRSIPFKVVCLIGLCDGVFPKNDSHDTFDLMGDNFQRGDRSPRADDRYQFMEALLAARTHLYLSYIGQSIRTNEVIPPSVVVTEFLEVLESGYGAKDIVVCHPLHPFSKKYYAEGSEKRLFSYNSYSCRTAESLQRGSQPLAQWWQGEVEGKIEKVVLGDLLRFYINPQKFFIKDCLGISLHTGEDLPDDREMFEVSGLEKYHVEEEMVRSELAGTMNSLCKKIQVEGLWPLGTSGQLAFEEKRLGIESFTLKVNAQQMGTRLVDIPVDFAAGRYRFLGTLSNLYENGVMLIRYGKLRGRDLLSGWIHHLVLNRLVPSAKTRIVAVDKVVSFNNDAAGPDLETLLRYYNEGVRAPSNFFVEPAFVYASQLANKRSRTAPIDKSLQTLKLRLQNGYEPEWELLFSGSGEDVEIGGDFERLCNEIMCPLWSTVDA
ncbi:MAG: exodeoxyribonuclease V subunit gamma [Desulfobulbaceae bacterium]|nr:exodeoxyribonuclease V subunit gamma [Desulfobulbaceae bacterium]